jgi:hypothetical protein
VRRAGPTVSGLGVVGLSVLIAVAAGCGQATTPSARDGGVLAAPAVTAIDAPSTSAPTSAVPSTSAAATTEPPVTSAVSAPPLVPRVVPNPPQTTQRTEPQSLTEAPLPEPPSIDTARVVVNQSNVAVNTGGSSSSRSIVHSAAADLVVQQGATGLEIASLELNPGWIESARAESPTEITLRYVLGSSAIDIRIWANGAGISSSVSASSDR